MTRTIKLWITRRGSWTRNFLVYLYSNKPSTHLGAGEHHILMTICREELYKKLGIRAFKSGRMLVELKIKASVLEFKELK